MPQDGDRVRGVFSVTLLQGLRLARDPQTGSITTGQLRSYLQTNMKTLLSPADLANDDIACMPEVYEPDTFDLVATPLPAPCSTSRCKSWSRPPAAPAKFWRAI